MLSHQTKICYRVNTPYVNICTELLLVGVSATTTTKYY